MTVYRLEADRQASSTGICSRKSAAADPERRGVNGADLHLKSAVKRSSSGVSPIIPDLPPFITRQEYASSHIQNINRHVFTIAIQALEWQLI